MITKKEPIQIRALRLAEKAFSVATPEGRYILARLRVKAAHAAKRAEKPKKTSFQYARDKLDQVFARFIRERDSKSGGFVCVTCQKVKFLQSLQAGHCFSRKYYSIRWNEKNVHGQCDYCNMQSTGRQAEHQNYIIKKYGVEALTELTLKVKGRQRKPTVEEMDRLRKYYEEKLTIIKE